MNGIKQGNRFIIQRRGDGLWDGKAKMKPKLMKKFPWERMGEVMVVAVFEENSLAVATQTIKELVRGDRLYMKKGY